METLRTLAEWYYGVAQWWDSGVRDTIVSFYALLDQAIGLVPITNVVTILFATGTLGLVIAWAALANSFRRKVRLTWTDLAERVLFRGVIGFLLGFLAPLLLTPDLLYFLLMAPVLVAPFIAAFGAVVLILTAASNLRGRTTMLTTL